MKRNPLILMGLILISGALGCSRSENVRRDQSYYREDSAYGSRRGSATSRAAAYGQPKKRVYVLPFINLTPLGGDELGDSLQEDLLRELRTTGKAIVPEDLKVSAHSRDFFSENKVRVAALSREGKRLGVSMLIVGRIKKIVYRTKGDEVGLFRQKHYVAAVDLEMRMFDVNAQRELLFDEKSADSESSQMNIFGTENDDPKNQRIELVRMALRNGARLLANSTGRALEKISWEGRIAKITSGRIYINAGRASGLNVGDILKVIPPGEHIYDPTTNAYLGQTVGQPKGTLEVVEFFGRDGSVAKVHSGGNFTEGDSVQLY